MNDLDAFKFSWSFWENYSFFVTIFGPIPMVLFLLSWIVYGVWMRGLFRQPAQWNPAQMVRRGLYFCLLNLALICNELYCVVMFLTSTGPCAGIPPEVMVAGILYHTMIFAAQLILYAALLWWRGRSFSSQSKSEFHS